MITMVVYDSQFGNTAKVANAIGKTLGSGPQVAVRPVGEFQLDIIRELGLLIVGSPTQRFNPTPGTSRFLRTLPEGGLQGIPVAAFDTRFTLEEIEKTPILAFLVRIFGYAAEPIGEALVKKGGTLLLPAEGFFVKEINGPLVEGEIERARSWAEKLSHLVEGDGSLGHN